MRVRTIKTLAIWCASAVWVVGGAAQPRAIDTKTSVMTVRVHKAGVLSAFGHDHEIAAPIASGTVDASARKVELQVRAHSLEVKDPGGPEKDRAQIRSTMLGPEVLDAERNPEIIFRSTSAEAAGQGVWKVQGNLTLHGQSRAITVEVREMEGHYEGTALLKQTEFGIKPVKAGGGAVRVKDEVEIQFNIHLAR